MGRPYVVIGAGLGGLATALRLAHRGERVLVLEKTGMVGGRNRPVEVGGSRFDGGPTLMMMMDPFRKLFTDVGERIEDHLDCRLCDPSYRVFYADGTIFEGTTNVPLMKERVAAMTDEDHARRYEKLHGDLKALYEASIPNFVRKNFYSPLDFFGLKQLGMVAKHGMIDNLARRVKRYADDPRLRMLYSFQTMYLGLSPYDAPWVYAVLTYMEYGEGIFYPMGGMTEICTKVAELAEKRGAEIRLNSPVSWVEGRTVMLESGEMIEAEAVICNADLPYAEKELQKKASPDRRYSCSAQMMYMDYRGELPGLEHHNVFFGPDFEGNLHRLFHEPLGLVDEPAFYACVSCKTDPAKADPGHQNLYILAPVPNMDRPLTEAENARLKEHVFRRLCQASDFDPANVAAMKTYSPADWETDLNLDKGAAFGLSHDFWQSAFFRPGNRSRSNPNMYFVGASTQPGNGLPMVLISAELVEDRLQHDGFLRA
ncbi:MAG: phytoene desaturase family protein [Fimbriimonadaceae bacterium]|nr:phytoene desaturase family protein [Fimbriimonadaceae bacterium]